MNNKIIKAVKKTDWRIICTAIITLGGLETVALLKGVDGLILSGVIGAICLLAGVKIQK